MVVSIRRHGEHLEDLHASPDAACAVLPTPGRLAFQSDFPTPFASSAIRRLLLPAPTLLLAVAAGAGTHSQLWDSVVGRLTQALVAHNFP